MSTPNNPHPLARRARELAEYAVGLPTIKQLLLDLAAEVEQSRERENVAYRRGQVQMRLRALMECKDGEWAEDAANRIEPLPIHDLPPEGE